MTATGSGVQIYISLRDEERFIHTYGGESAQDIDRCFFPFCRRGRTWLDIFRRGWFNFFITLLSLIFLIWFEKLRNNRMEIELPGCQSQKFSEKRLCF